MYKIEIVENKEIKSKITDDILHNLPEWFGIEESIVEYIQSVKDKIFYGVYYDEKIVGFLSLKVNNKYSAEIYVMGILKQHQGSGQGRKLISVAQRYLRDNDYRFIMVKTLSDAVEYEPYRITREFYKSIGFYPLDESDKIWDEKNPCLIMVKNI